MIVFLVVAGLMVLVALAWVLPPLLRRRAEDGVQRASSNLAVLRDQLSELDADLANGTIDPAQHARARAELERRVLEETRAEGEGLAKSGNARWLAAGVSISIPLAATLLYLQLGDPAALATRQGAHGESRMSPEEVEQLVARLAARMESNPQDPNGWALLGRSYFVMGRYAQAAKAYARLNELVADDPDVLAEYADALAMSQDGRIDGKALELVNQALKVNGDHAKSLALAGTAAIDRKDYKAAVAHFERLQSLVPPDSEFGKMAAERLQEARPVAGAASAPKVASAGASGGGSSTIAGRVALSPALTTKVAPTDTVFVLARAPQGPRMPLAIMRRQVKDLPFHFSLSDAQAMSPEMKLSNFSDVVVIARISKSGGATPQSGDLQGVRDAVKVGTAKLEIVIDSVVP